MAHQKLRSPEYCCGMCSYPVLRLLGVTAALALYIAAGVLTGYPGRLVPCGAVLASCSPGMRHIRARYALCKVLAGIGAPLIVGLGNLLWAGQRATGLSCCSVLRDARGSGESPKGAACRLREHSTLAATLAWHAVLMAHCREQAPAAVCAGLLVLPHLKSEKYEWWVPYCALLTSVVLLLLVPIVIYAARFPRLSC